MRSKKEIFELKFHELKFSLKKLEIHEKINNEAMHQFSKYFKDYIDTIDNRAVKHRLKKIAGLVGENEKSMNKTARRAKQQGQYKRRKNKIQPDFEEETIQLPPEKPKKTLPKEYKSLYRKIANKTHPDKVGDDDEKKELFRKVTSAVDSENYFKLIEFATLLDIEIPDEVPVDVGDLDNKITDIQHKVKQITKSVAWEWYHLEKEDQKKTLIEGYAKFLLDNK